MVYTRELNLLPPSRRRYLAQQLLMNSVVRFLRSINLALTVVSGTGVAAIIILQVLTALLSSGTTITLQEQIKQYQELRTQIAKQNENLSFMSKLSTGQVVWSSLLSDFFSTMPPGTKLNRLSAEVGTDTKLSFGGQAVSRSALVVLQDRMENLAWVKHVNAPSSNLLERSNPLYSFDVILKVSGGDLKPTPVPTPVILETP